MAKLLVSAVVIVTPVPLAVAFKQIVFDTVRVVLMGIVLAWINRR